jgi:hypothetical protein
MLVNTGSHTQILLVSRVLVNSESQALIARRIDSRARHFISSQVHLTSVGAFSGNIYVSLKGNS